MTALNATKDDALALRQALAVVREASDKAARAEDLDAIKRSLRETWEAATNAHHLCSAIEDSTRNRALSEVESALEQRVGMEAVSL